MSSIKPANGYFFEDFSLGQILKHGVPRTITESDATMYLALTGSRFPLYCAKTIAERCGFKSTPIDNLLVFHIAFGKSVNDVSLNAVANLGYAEVFFHRPTLAGDTLSVSSQVIGLKENSNGKTGVVYVHSTATDQTDKIVVEWKRWVMIKKNNHQVHLESPCIPDLQDSIKTEQQNISSALDFSNWDSSDSDNQATFDDVSINDLFVNQSGMTINDSDHSMATRLYQNNARVHFDQSMMQQTANGQRLVYGGHIISMTKTLSYSGLSNAFWLSAINAGTHCNPSFAGDTIYSQSRIIEKVSLPDRNDLGLVRIQMIATKNQSPDSIESLYQDTGKRRQYHSNVVLDLDYYSFMWRA